MEMLSEPLASEEEMRIPIRDWLSQKGLLPVDELPIAGKIPDIVGIENGRISVAIEMKLTNWRRALYQATLYTMFADRSYIAMPENKKELLSRNLQDIRKWGVDVLIVAENNSVYELSPSIKKNSSGRLLE
jgi:hypothetical protein